MSVPTAAQAIEIAKRVRYEKERLLEIEIDKDVQKLKERAVALINSVEPDNQGYYGFKIDSGTIIYRDPKVVISKFCLSMESLGYVVPKVIHKRGFMSKKAGSYIFQFRVDPHRVKKDEGVITIEPSFSDKVGSVASCSSSSGL